MANVLELELISYPNGWEYSCISKGLTIGTKIIEEFESSEDLERFVYSFGEATFHPCDNKYGINFKRENFKIIQTLKNSFHEKDCRDIYPQGSSDRHRSYPVSPTDFVEMMESSVKLSKNEVDLKIAVQEEVKVSL